MNIGAVPALDRLDPSTGGKWYHDPEYQKALARLDVVILGFFPGWRGDTDGSVIRQAVVGLKALNPLLKVGQYSVLGESVADPARTFNDDVIVKLNETNWWLRDAVTGAQTQWSTAYSAYDINITDWSPPDANGDRYPQWLARRNFQRYFSPVPEIDVWYFDGLMRYSRIPQANWRWDGVNVSSQDPEVATRFRQGHAAHLASAAALAPDRLQLGNSDNGLTYPEYRGLLSGAVLEGMMGKAWSLEVIYSWEVMMERYFTVVANLKAPALTAFNVWGEVNDYRFFRYAFASCRLGDAHFNFTDNAAGYASVPWFDEYEVSFGPPVDPPTLQPWSNGVHRRRYEKAMVLVNPNADPRSVTIEPGWRRVLALQDPVANDGTPVGQLTLGPREGLVLVRE
jgi:hypothetical protein